MAAPSSVLAATIPAPNEPVRVVEFARPALDAGAALLHVLFSEVCGTDVHLHHGKLSGVPYPLIPGHVSVGTIAELRGPLADVEGTRSMKATSSRFSTSTRRAAHATTAW